MVMLPSTFDKITRVNSQKGLLLFYCHSFPGTITVVKIRSRPRSHKPLGTRSILPIPGGTGLSLQALRDGRLRALEQNGSDPNSRGAKAPYRYLVRGGEQTEREVLLRRRARARAPPPRRAGPAIPRTPGLRVGDVGGGGSGTAAATPGGRAPHSRTQNGGRRTWGRRHREEAGGRPAARPRRATRRALTLVAPRGPEGGARMTERPLPAAAAARPTPARAARPQPTVPPPA